MNVPHLLQFHEKMVRKGAIETMVLMLENTNDPDSQVGQSSDAPTTCRATS